MTLRKTLLLLSLSALLLPLAQATTPATDTPAVPQARPLLWKVSDADNSVYLLGAFHLLKEADYPLPVEVDRAFDDAESLLFEVDPQAMTSPQALAAMQKYMAYADGGSLSTVLPKATLAKLDAMVTASGGSMAAMEGSEPWAVNLGLLMGVTQSMGFRPDLGLDRHLMERAAKAGKPAGGLETVEDQFRAMDSVPHAEQVKGLGEFLDDPRKLVQQMGEMHAWWRAGDVARLDADLRAEMATEAPHTYRLLNVERNRAWLPQVERRLAGSKADDTLVVVGALHLLGDDGLVEQLRAKGYAVERVCDACGAAE